MVVHMHRPMYLMCRKIKAAGIKMVLSGEGADEVLGGYLYFHKAPNKEEHHLETVRKVKDLHYYDCLRANKATMAWGVEARVPFLDKGFLDYAMGLDPENKLCGALAPDKRIEKWALRAAFDTPDNPYLPKEVLWRQKEQFSDGVVRGVAPPRLAPSVTTCRCVHAVHCRDILDRSCFLHVRIAATRLRSQGYDWIDSLREIAGVEITDAQLAPANHRFPYPPPPPPATPRRPVSPPP
jgi:hypothetical protein